MAKKKSAKSSKRRKPAVKDLPAKSEVKGGILYSATQFAPNPPPVSISPVSSPMPPPI